MSGPADLTADQRRRIEENRQRALRLRESRARTAYLSPSLAENPQSNVFHNAEEINRTFIGATRAPPAPSRRPIDSDAGFLVEPEEEPPQTNNNNTKKKVAAPHPRAPSPERTHKDYYTCDDCHEDFWESFLMTKFKVSVCNTCRAADVEEEERYGLVTKTTAKNDYLLLDEDLEGYDTSLLYITKKNPRGLTYADMKLYLRMQVEERSFKKFGGEEGLDAEIAKRSKTKAQRRVDKYEQKLLELRRKTLPRKDQTITRHEHEYGEEVMDEATGKCTQTCSTCGFSVSYEVL